MPQRQRALDFLNWRWAAIPPLSQPPPPPDEQPRRRFVSRGQQPLPPAPWFQLLDLLPLLSSPLVIFLPALTVRGLRRGVPCKVCPLGKPLPPTSKDSSDASPAGQRAHAGSLSHHTSVVPMHRASLLRRAMGGAGGPLGRP